MTSDTTHQPGPPSWLTSSCPSWCVWGEAHKEKDRYDDRSHESAFNEIALTAADPAQDDEEAPIARSYLMQHYREHHPRIVIDRSGVPTGLVLTTDEATNLAHQLLELVQAAHATKSNSQGNQTHQR